MSRSWGKSVHAQSAARFRQRTGQEPQTQLLKERSYSCVLSGTWLVAYCPLTGEEENVCFCFVFCILFLENLPNSHWLCSSEISGWAAAWSPNGARKIILMSGICLMFYVLRSQIWHLLEQSRLETCLGRRAVGTKTTNGLIFQPAQTVV